MKVTFACQTTCLPLLLDYTVVSIHSIFVALTAFYDFFIKLDHLVVVDTYSSRLC